MGHEVISRDLMKTWAPGESYHLLWARHCSKYLHVRTIHPHPAFYRWGHRGSERLSHFTACCPAGVTWQSQDASSEGGPPNPVPSSVLSRFLKWEALEVFTPSACLRDEQVRVGWTKSHGRCQLPSCFWSGVWVIPTSSSRLLFCHPCLGSWASRL